MNSFTITLLKILKKTRILNFLRIKSPVTINNKRFIIPIINGTGYPNIFLVDDWLLLLLNKFCKTENEIFIDVGINIGQTLLAIKSLDNNISYIGFEPNLSCVSYLATLIKNNNINKCLVEPFALSDQIKFVLLEKDDETDPRASIINELRPEYFSSKEKVLTLNFDSLPISEPVCVVKIDVEGAELDVLKGMTKMIEREQPIIICEVLDSHNDSTLSFTQTRATLLGDFLKSIKYSIIQIETNYSRNQVIAFHPIDEIKIKQWTYDSSRLNDYIFCPLSRLSEVRESISYLINQNN